MPKKILVIDDEKLVTDSLRKLLKRVHYDVEIAGDARQALKRVANEDFDLIITDIRMPELDGVETVKRIREVVKERKRKKIPEILITGYADPQTESQARSLGVADYIYKPFDLVEFLSVVKRIIGNG